MSSDRDQNGLERMFRLHELQQFVEKFMAHQTLRDEFVLPMISRIQLLLGAVVLSKSGLAQVVRDRVLAAMMMIYHALSLHDEVSEGLTREEKKRQLTVLGGDYLSSLFYRLLAETDHIEMIRVFTKAIIHINEAKASLQKALFDGSYNDYDYLSDVRTIHGALIQSLCEIFLPGERTAEFVKAAVEASLYDQELAKRSEVKGKTLANAILGRYMTSEEKRQFVAFSQSGTAIENRYMSLHVKYGTFSHVVEGFREAVQRLQEITIEMFGVDGWNFVEQLFHPIGSLEHEGIPYEKGVSS